MTDEPRVLIGYPSALVRSVLETALVRRGLPVVATVGLAADLRLAAADPGAQVVVSGARFPDRDLLTVLAPVLSSGARVLVVCREGEEVADLLFAGASGCLFVDDATPTDVARGVRTVHGGRATLHPTAAHAVLSRWRAERDAPAVLADGSGRAALTSRERDVLAAMAEGLSTREIARTLAISAKTVEAHKARVFSKLGARNHAHAISIAVTQGVLLARKPSDEIVRGAPLDGGAPRTNLRSGANRDHGETGPRG